MKKNQILLDQIPLNISEFELLCFGNKNSINNKKFNKIITSSGSDLATGKGFGYWSGCHKIDDNIFIINSDQDGTPPNIHTVHMNNKLIGIYIHCGLWAIENLQKYIKNKKRSLEKSKIKISGKKLIFFLVPDFELKSFNKKEINKFNKNINDFIADRSKTEKLCEFELSDKSFNIYTFNSEIEVLGHYIELIKL
jgi:hypothetical protein